MKRTKFDASRNELLKPVSEYQHPSTELNDQYDSVTTARGHVSLLWNLESLENAEASDESMNATQLLLYRLRSLRS